MMILRDLIPDDISIIKNWPTYPPEFVELDYALRNNGWLDEYSIKPDTRIFAFEQAEQLVAFSILSITDREVAEFRLALRSDKTGQGLGHTLTRMTLQQGFDVLGLQRVHLIVRHSNPRAARLYTRSGFKATGECTKILNGKSVEFVMMEIQKQAFDGKTS